MENIFLERFQELLNERYNGNKANLSKATGISAPTLSQYFPPRCSSPSARQLVLLSQAFDCTVDYLLGLEDELGISKKTTLPIEIINGKVVYNDDEKELIYNFRQLNEAEQYGIMVQTKALAIKKRKTTKV